VHDPAGCISDSLISAHWRRRYLGWSPYRQSNPKRTGAVDRLLCKHAGDAGEAGSFHNVRRAAKSAQGSCPRRLCQSDPAVRCERLQFEMLLERLQPVRDLSHSPVFQVLFVLQNAPMTELMLPDLQVTPLLLDTGKTHFDLTLSVAEEESELHLSFEYSSQLFD